MSFQDIIGQRQAIKMLQANIASSSIANAYLFVGPEGVGRTLTAFTFAKALNCERGGKDSCDSCSSCRKIDHLNHPDVRTIKPEGNSIKIDQIRDLKREIGYKLYEGKKRVWIIQEADKLTLEASNSLLKILEEPPSTAVLILIAQSLRNLPPTISSRCQLIRFLPLSSRQIEKLLNERLGGEPQKIRLIGRLSKGRVSEAMKLMKEETFLREREDLLNRIGGELKIEDVFSLADRWKSYDREKIEDFLDVLLFWFRDLLVLNQKGDQNLIVNLDRTDQLKRYAKMYSSWAIKQAILTIERTKDYLRDNVTPKFALEVMGLKLMRILEGGHSEGMGEILSFPPQRFCFKEKSF